MMQGDEEGFRRAVAEALVEQLVKGEIVAWAHWGTPEQRLIARLPTRLAPGIDPAVIVARARSEMMKEIRNQGGSAQEAASAYLEFAPDHA